MILISGGTIIDPSQNIEQELDLLVDGSVIKDSGKPGSFANATVEKTIDAKNRWIIPGLVDVHVHLREPGFEWKETIKTGADAAVLGGYTSICCMPNTKPVNDCAEITKFILDKARGARAKVLPIGAVSRGLLGKEMSPLSELRKNGCVGFSDDGEPIWNSGLMRRALEWARVLDVPICCHEEDKSLSCGGSMNESSLSFRLGLLGMNTLAEDVMVARDIEIARVTKGKIHICHISSARGVELIRRAKNDGILVTAETTPHHITLSEDAVNQYDANSKMSPPLRDSEDISGLIDGLRDGTIDAIASDHAPHEMDSKTVEFGAASFGITGLQTSLPLVLAHVRSGALTRSRAIEALAHGPSKAFGFAGGSLKKGAPADIVIVDPEAKWRLSPDKIASLSKNTPFLGAEMQGVAESVLVNGKIVVYNAELAGE